MPRRGPFGLRERRRGHRDRVRRFISRTVIGSWIAFVTGLAIVVVAKPESASGVYSWGGAAAIRRTWWDKGALEMAAVCFGAALVVSIVGLVASMRRDRRKGDRYSVSLIFTTVVSGGALVLFFAALPTL